jgi:hypothetical protein
MTNQFSDPGAAGGGGDRLPYPELLGSLLLITVREEVAQIETSFGPSSAVRVSAVALDGALNGQQWPDALVFPRVLQSQLRGRVGQQVLARLTQGEAQPGKSPPWQLTAATDADREIGRRYTDHVAKTPAPATAQPWDEEPF